LPLLKFQPSYVKYFQPNGLGKTYAVNKGMLVI